MYEWRVAQGIPTINVMEMPREQHVGFWNVLNQHDPETEGVSLDVYMHYYKNVGRIIQEKRQKFIDLATWTRPQAEEMFAWWQGLNEHDRERFMTYRNAFKDSAFVAEWMAANNARFAAIAGEGGRLTCGAHIRAYAEGIRADADSRDWAWWKPERTDEMYDTYYAKMNEFNSDYDGVTLEDMHVQGGMLQARFSELWNPLQQQ